MSFTNHFTLSIEFKEIFTVFIGIPSLIHFLFYRYIKSQTKKSQGTNCQRIQKIFVRCYNNVLK